MDLRHTRAVQRLSNGPAVTPESCPSATSPINLGRKRAGKPTAGNPHGGFEAAGIGNGLTVRLVRHSQRKRGATDRLNLRSTAPVLDPTGRGVPLWRNGLLMRVRRYARRSKASSKCGRLVRGRK